jgi:hypothetical protein
MNLMFVDLCIKAQFIMNLMFVDPCIIVQFIMNLMFVDPCIIVKFIMKNPTICNNVSKFHYSIYI